MKIFNSLKQLLDYCNVCPVCQNQRETNVAIGPDTKFKFIISEQNGSNLEIRCTFLYSEESNFETSDDALYKAMAFMATKAEIDFVVDSENNTYSYTVNNKSSFLSTDKIIDAIDKEDFCFWIYSNCKCDCSVNTLDVEFNSVTKTISNIGIEQEAIWLTRTEHMFHLSIHPKENNMQVTKLVRDENGDLLDNSKIIKLPCINFDYSNEERLVTRIRTMLVFS